VRVAVDGAAEPIGFLALDPGVPQELVALFVDAPAIGTGAGRALLADARRMVAAAGGTGMLVESDPNAVGFYLGHGAVRVGDRRSASTGRWLPLLWLPAAGA
jgi:GNAT superfamily N-acetyltransferase